MFKVKIRFKMSQLKLFYGTPSRCISRCIATNLLNEKKNVSSQTGTLIELLAKDFRQSIEGAIERYIYKLISLESENLYKVT
jgi:hypothetical protein